MNHNERAALMRSRGRSACSKYRFRKVFACHNCSSDEQVGLETLPKIGCHRRATNAEDASTLEGMSEHTEVIERRTTTVQEARRMHPAIGRGRLYAALREGHIRSAKVGKRIAIDVADLDRWVMAGAPASLQQ